MMGLKPAFACKKILKYTNTELLYSDADKEGLIANAGQGRRSEENFHGVQIHVAGRNEVK